MSFFLLFKELLPQGETKAVFLACFFVCPENKAKSPVDSVSMWPCNMNTISTLVHTNKVCVAFMTDDEFRIASYQGGKCVGIKHFIKLR